MSRVVVWFSCGAASAVAGKLAQEKYGDQVIFACCVIPNEHPDNERFLKDCEKWYGKEIIRMSNPEYKDAWDVWEKTKYLVGPMGARCSIELKKRLRNQFQKMSDIQVFGFTKDEEKRAKQFIRQNPETNIYTPLIEVGYTKQDCFRIIQEAGIELPAMYKLGYNNNNCIGCVKGGLGYWNKIRRDFPEVFERMAKLERSIGKCMLKHKGRYTFLDQIPEDAGRYSSELDFQCGVLCGTGKETE